MLVVADVELARADGVIAREIAIPGRRITLVDNLDRFERVARWVEPLTGNELRAPVFLIPLTALAGYAGTHRLAGSGGETATSGFRLQGPVTHVRDGDPIEVACLPIRISNLDCAEMETRAGIEAKVVIRQLVVQGEASCRLEGRRSCDREVGTCSIEGAGDLGEAMISGRAYSRW